MANHPIDAQLGISVPAMPDRPNLVFIICFYNDPLDQPGARGPKDPPAWELFDLDRDPHELHDVYADPDYTHVRRELEAELLRLQRAVGDTPHPAVAPA